MPSVSELERTLKQYLSWNKSRVYCLVQLVLGMIKVRTVNLTELACAMEGKAQQSSCYRRIQRFFEEVEMPYHLIAYLIAGLFFAWHVLEAVDRSDQLAMGPKEPQPVGVECVLSRDSYPSVLEGTG